MSQPELNETSKTRRPPSSLRSGLIGAGWYVVLLGVGVGCVGWGGNRPFAWKATDPSGLSPSQQSLNPPTSGSRQDVSRPIVPDGLQPVDSSQGEDSLGPVPPTVATIPRPQLEAPEPDHLSLAEQPVPEGIAAHSPLTVSTSLAKTATLNSPTQLTIAIQNDTPFVADNVRLWAQFGPDWEFAGTSEETIEQRLGTIPADRSREVTLQLSPVRTGRCCLELRVSSESHESVSRTLCADIGERLVDLEVVGPSRRTVGSRAEYVVTLTNSADQKLDETVVTVNYPPSLLLKELSAGASRRPGRLEWDLGTMLDQERVQIQIEFECREASADAFTEILVSSAGERVILQPARLTIVEPHLLKVDVADESDPITAGEIAVFHVRLQNRSSRPAENLELLVDPSATLELVTILRDGRDVATQASGDGEVILPRTPLAPGATFEYEVRAATRSAGIAELTVLAQADILDAPISVRERLVVNPSTVDTP